MKENLSTLLPQDLEELVANIKLNQQEFNYASLAQNFILLGNYYLNDNHYLVRPELSSCLYKTRGKS